MNRRSLVAGMLAGMFMLGCSSRPPEERQPAAAADLKPALEIISSEGLLRHIKVLASDEYEGRAPGTKGEELTVTYLTDQFTKLGLKPGNPDGTFVQKVPLIGFKAQPEAFLQVGATRLDLRFPEDYVAVSRRLEPEIKVRD